MDKINKLFKELWNEYTKVNPQTQEILDLFKEKEQSEIHNDHIALRTIKSDLIGIDQVAETFINLGYEKKDFYTFDQKKLDAYYYAHPNKEYPKVFISEIRPEDLSDFAQEQINNILSYINENTNLLTSGTNWPKSYEVYNKLYKESEYLAWFYAYGFIPNHFTVSVNKLKTFKNLNEVNEWLESKGFVLNNSGGKIKGSPEEYLEQSSTMASKKEVQFNEGKYLIPSCYYEFALRHNGYEGFIAKSADKIFESTNE